MPAPLSTSSPTFPPPPAARHYHPTLSIWLSVDPLADKYPSTSPYTYCANNPVRLVDPNGRDIWEINECGDIQLVERSETDCFRFVNDKRKVLDEKIFSRKIVNDDFTLMGENKDSHYLRIDNGNDADELYGWISDKLEFSLGEVTNSYVENFSGERFNLLGFDVDADCGLNYSTINLLKSNDYKVLSSTHNHPFDSDMPSGEEDLFYPRHYPQTTFSIRTSGNYCLPYTENSPTQRVINLDLKIIINP